MFLVFTVIPDSTPCLLHLLLLTDLFVHSSSRPTHNPSLCGMFGSMVAQVDRLINLYKKLHELSDDELRLVAVEHRLHDLPHIQHTAAHFSSLKCQLTSFNLHMDWLKTAKDNVSLSSQAVEDASTHLRQLSNLVKASLLQISEEAPRLPSPSLPVASTAFDVLQFSIEMSERLRVFCDWSKRVLRHLQRLSRCPKH
uniref:Uncharacterized LOC113126879 n=1 Tax=Mastacembelus armatus TaxID=205130 RepID=A0A7N8WLD9_9TELE